MNRERARVLAVDDNETNRMILREILEDDYEYAEAVSGEQALEVAAEFDPDVVLLDVMMPGIDGYETCRRLRADRAFRSVKILMISARAMPSDRIEGYEAGANDYVTKPFNLQELQAKVAVFANLRSVEDLVVARQDGMAQVASEVLHNVGNVLTSLRTSVHEMKRISGLLRPTQLEQAAKILEDQEDLARFVTEDERGRLLPRLLSELAAHGQRSCDELAEEVGRLDLGLQHVNAVVSAQREQARIQPSMGLVGAREMIEDAVALAQGQDGLPGMDLRFDVGTDLACYTDRHRALQIVVNLIRNAMDAMRGVADPRLEVRAEVGEQGVVSISVKDNGHGIEEAVAERLFEQGFSAKDGGRGFGLHSAATMAKFLGGGLGVVSDGPGKGACFTLELPGKTSARVA